MKSSTKEGTDHPEWYEELKLAVQVMLGSHTFSFTISWLPRFLTALTLNSLQPMSAPKVNLHRGLNRGAHKAESTKIKVVKQ